MTSSILQNKRFITPERASIILPTIISSFVAFIIISAFVIPKYVKSNKVNNEYKEFLRKKEELSQLKLQYQIINEKLNKLNERKANIIYLVSGKSNLDTFIERIGFISKKNEIKILSIMPKNIIKYIPVETSVEASGETSNVNIDPLLAEGIKKYTMDLNFESDFKNLLSFFRELELQESIISFEDLKLKLKNDLESTLQVSVEIIVYGKNDFKKNKV